MNDDEMRNLWQNQPLPEPSSKNLAALARDQHRQLQRTIFWRDVREVGTGVVLIPIWIVLGIRGHANWIWYLMIPALLFVVGFILVDRFIQRGWRPHLGDPVTESLRKSVGEVDHHIWLLRNIAWWYLAPIGAVLVLINVDRLLRGRQGPVGFALGVLFTAALFGGIWWLNQNAVRKKLQPRRAELQTCLEEMTKP